jgi:hypothetical protein
MSDNSRSSADSGRGRLLVWQVTETAGFESAWMRVAGLRLRAVGRAVGQLPVPYWLSYTLETDNRAVTTRLEVTVTVPDSERRLELRRDQLGWIVDGQRRPDLADALDCDLASSPVTNTMPVIRHELQRSPGGEQFVMAFVAVPSLRVGAVRQAYTHLGLVDGGARVRYSSGEYSSDLLVDEDGLVIDYPTMARRIGPRTEVAREAPRRSRQAAALAEPHEDAHLRGG